MKILCCKNHTYYDNFKLKLCACAKVHALGTCTKFQLENSHHNVISGIVYFTWLFWRARKMLMKPSFLDKESKYKHYRYNVNSCMGRIFSCDQAAIWLVQSVCLSVRLSVRPSVRLSHLFHHVPIIVSSWNFQELLPWSKVMSMQKVKVRGQRSRSQRSTTNLAVSGL